MLIKEDTRWCLEFTLDYVYRFTDIGDRQRLPMHLILDAAYEMNANVDEHNCYVENGCYEEHGCFAKYVNPRCEDNITYAEEFAIECPF